MIDLTRAAALLTLALLAACSDDGRDASSSSSSTGPNFTVCADCPIGGVGVCPEGQVCASITPGSGGVCMLACDDSDPAPCVLDGVVTGTCKAFSPDETRACNSPDNGPVCPPKE